MADNKNFILAIVLSIIVLVVWQYFVGMPQMERQRQAAEQQRLEQLQREQAARGDAAPQTPAADGRPVPAQTPGAPPAPGAAPPGQAPTRDAALAAAPRIPVETERLRGSISLRGVRFDDLALTQYRETVDPASPAVVLLSPSGSPQPFYGEFGWVAPPGSNVRVPGPDTVWSREGSGPLGVNRPVTLTWDNGGGLVFRRTLSVDDRFMFTVRDEVTNRGDQPVTLFPYGLVSRHGTPKTLGYYILHEGLIGFIGDQGLQEYTYSAIQEARTRTWNVTGAWLGITDKYWAATLVPDPQARVTARYMYGTIGTLPTYQADFLMEGRQIAPGASTDVTNRLFAGAKEVAVVDGYETEFKLNRFELLIDWGWFYFITKPLFVALDWFFRVTGNFGLAILIVTVLIKLVFFPLANKSYASMAKMKAVQPEMMAIRERFAQDKMKQQQALMDLYQKEKINPLSGCLPILIQIPVFFALYKVLFVTIEMRHAPFYGWIKDLSAPDPTSIFNLFGLLPYSVPEFLLVGIWPILMGFTMFLQMKMNPEPPDPTQRMIFTWMPLIFTFLLATFPAGLVIYWTWNNLLSVAQQGYIMRKHGVKIELWDNLKSMVTRKPASS